jgi:hypothetical protein
MVSWRRGDELPAGYRWLQDLVGQFWITERRPGHLDRHLECWKCQRKWRLREGHDEIKQANYRWLIEHAWTHAELPIVAAENFYAAPEWLTGRFEQLADKHARRGTQTPSSRRSRAR